MTVEQRLRLRRDRLRDKWINKLRHFRLNRYSKNKDKSRTRLIEVETATSCPSHVDASPKRPVTLQTIRVALIHHLGTSVAADAWLISSETGYPTSAMQAIREGNADLVMADLEQQWGPSPAHA